MNRYKDIIEKVISFFKKMPKNISIWKTSFINRRNYIFSIDEDIQRDERVIFRDMDKGELKEQEVHELLEKIDNCIRELKSLKFFY